MRDAERTHDLDAVGAQAELAVGDLNDRGEDFGEKAAPAPAGAAHGVTVLAEKEVEVGGGKAPESIGRLLDAAGTVPQVAAETPAAAPRALRAMGERIEAHREFFRLYQLGAAHIDHRDGHGGGRSGNGSAASGGRPAPIARAMVTTGDRNG